VVSKLDAVRQDWRECAASHELASGGIIAGFQTTATPGASAISSTLQRAAEGVLAREADKWFDLEIKKGLAGGYGEDIAEFRKRLEERLRSVAEDLRSDAQTLETLANSIGRPVAPTVGASSLKSLGETFKGLDKFAASLAKVTHLDPEVASGLQNAVGVVMGAVEIISATSFLGGASAFLSLITLLNGSGMAPRDKTMSDMKNSLDRIEKALSTLQDQSRAIIWRLDRLEQTELFNSTLIFAAGIGGGLRDCHDFLDSRKKDEAPSISTIEAHVSTYPEKFKSGRGALERVFEPAVPTAPSPFDEALLRQTLEQAAGARKPHGTSVVSHLYQPLLDFFVKRCGDLHFTAGEQQSWLECFLRPAESISQLKEKIQFADAGRLGRCLEKWRREVALNIPLSNSLRKLLEPASVDWVVTDLLAFVPYWDWVRADSIQFQGTGDWAQVFGSDRASAIKSAQQRRLLWALHIVDVALAQQSMIAGDALLPWLATEWTPLTDKSDKSQLTGPLVIDFLSDDTVLSASTLALNPILASNYILYSLKKQGPAVPTLTYAAALRINHPNLLPGLFKPVAEAPHPLQFEWLEKPGIGPNGDSGWAGLGREA
jgi:hypothetical protein